MKRVSENLLKRIKDNSKGLKGKKKSSKDLWSAGKSVETVNSVESATAIMRRLGESLEDNRRLH